MQNLRLSEIWIYPIKSLGGISLDKVRVMPKGLQFDRRWMLIDDQGTFLSQRTLPRLALLKLDFHHDHLQVSYGDQNIALHTSAQNFSEPLIANVWNDAVTVYEVSPQHSRWFSDVLQLNCRLVYFPEENPRPVDADYRIKDEHVSLADAFPFLIIGQSSLEDLNSRLREPLPMNRFRPNFVISGGNPFAEDTWRNFSIGSNEFTAVKPCARCIMTTVNQDTAQRGTEPLKTLATYRATNNKILFGQNVIATRATEIKVGDPVSIQSYR